MKTKTPTPVSLVRLARKRARDHTIGEAQQLADHHGTVHFVYEVPALGQFPFVYIPAGAVKPKNGKFIVQVNPS